MKFEMNKKEYRLLLDMVCIAKHVMLSANDPQNCELYLDLIQRLMSHYKEMDVDVLIDQGKKSHYKEKAIYKEYLDTLFIERYDDGSFWDELIDRMAMKEMILNIGFEAFHTMDEDERDKQLTQIGQRYFNEFDIHGLEHLVVKYPIESLN